MIRRKDAHAGRHADDDRRRSPDNRREVAQRVERRSRPSPFSRRSATGLGDGMRRAGSDIGLRAGSGSDLIAPGSQRRLAGSRFGWPGNSSSGRICCSRSTSRSSSISAVPAQALPKQLGPEILGEQPFRIEMEAVLDHAVRRSTKQRRDQPISLHTDRIGGEPAACAVCADRRW